MLLYVHGGGFRILSKNTHRAIARHFALGGYLVVNINYRLTPAGTFPHALQDVCDALHWTLENIEAYGGDPNRLVYAGESAGGNLTLSLAMLGCFERPEPWAKRVFEAQPKVQAVLPPAACSRFISRSATSRTPRYPSGCALRIKVICDGYRGDSPEGSLASPLQLLESDTPSERPLPPIFSICGDRDYVVEDTHRLGRPDPARQRRRREDLPQRDPRLPRLPRRPCETSLERPV